jgi:rod shape-determining protein MreD
MVELITKYGLRLLLLLGIQILIINQIDHFHHLYPFIYIYFIISLPFKTPVWALLLIAFGCGIIIDIFEYTPGMHASATLTAAFFRYIVSGFFRKKVEITNVTEPHFSSLGKRGFSLFVLLISFVHHAKLYFLEVYTFTNFWSTMGKISLNTIASVIIIIIIDLLFFKNKTKE